MTKTINRHTGEADARPKENGAPGQESAVENSHPDSTAEDERGIYHPLTWRAERSDRNHVKNKRIARKQAIERKHGGNP